MKADLEIGLHAVVVAVAQDGPLVLTVPEPQTNADAIAALPFGPFDPVKHRTLDIGLRNWVEEQTRLSLGYVEQLYTFGDQGRIRAAPLGDVNLVSIGYLALVRIPAQNSNLQALNWHGWYHFFPWEDWRKGTPVLLSNVLLPALTDWVRQAPEQTSGADGLERLARFRLAFGCDLPKSGIPKISSWDEERVLERYELMYEAGLVEEAFSDGAVKTRTIESASGHVMLHDHRRILATAIARLRAKLKYRPVVFELMPNDFTLTELQNTVEMLSGRKVHKQNFRRLVESAELVEPTGAQSSQTGGRPAALYRFRRNILRERPAPGLRIGSSG